jgi:hypothetical protein
MKWTFAAPLIFLALMATAVQAQEAPPNLPAPSVTPGLPGASTEKPQKADTGPVVYKAIYNPETKSYFELYQITVKDVATTGGIPDISWGEAKTLAESRAYKGARGRLAVVKTEETNKFIVKNLRPSGGTWIGLRYICSTRTLQWVTGEIWPLSSYTNWHSIWNSPLGGPGNGSARANCPSWPYLGVHYWGADGGFKWNANGAPKRFYYMIIEFPTGKP